MKRFADTIRSFLLIVITILSALPFFATVDVCFLSKTREVMPFRDCGMACCSLQPPKELAKTAEPDYCCTTSEVLKPISLVAAQPCEKQTKLAAECRVCADVMSRIDTLIHDNPATVATLAKSHETDEMFAVNIYIPRDLCNSIPIRSHPPDLGRAPPVFL